MNSCGYWIYGGTISYNHWWRWGRCCITAAVEQSNFGIVDVTMSNNGVGYAATPTVTIVGQAHLPAIAEVNLLSR